MGFFLAGFSSGSFAGTRQIVGEDDFGRTIVLAKPPDRIILLSGSPIDVIYELGAGDALVGVVDSIAASYPETCRRYPSVLEKERVGRFSDPNIEKIISLDPDLIIPFGTSDSPGKYTAVFDRRGLPYAAFVSVENTGFGIRQIMRLGKLLGREKEARILAARIRTDVDTISRQVASKIKERPLVYYWWGVGNGTYGRRTAINELIELAGGVNLAGEFDAQYMELSPEYVIARDPDVIVISYWKESQKKERMSALKNRPGFRDIKAVKNNRVYLLEGHSFHTPVRFAEVIQKLAGYIHPGIFDTTNYSAGLRP